MKQKQHIIVFIRHNDCNYMQHIKHYLLRSTDESRDVITDRSDWSYWITWLKRHLIGQFISSSVEWMFLTT